MVTPLDPDDPRSPGDDPAARGGPGLDDLAASGAGPNDPRGSSDPAPGIWADDPDRRRFTRPPAWAGHPTQRRAASGAPQRPTMPAKRKVLAFAFAALGAALFAVAVTLLPPLLAPDRASNPAPEASCCR
ncbi:hypothetical protein FDA94_25005 [Herbidospora galbida]|uniref:Uncharacterized protein n=1 Tax=Herbidospora galbida TaxID=2575442 RepID=A0A4U3MBA3_9ACTN|nr:hypothetical protein [Herbidospora galbida]TKK85652.1 hypothetical protein FDA94_25005 [Herbidospora galbida]